MFLILPSLPRGQPACGQPGGLPWQGQEQGWESCSKTQGRVLPGPWGLLPQSSFMSWIPGRPQTGVCRPAALSALPVVPGQAPHMAVWGLWECPAPRAGGWQAGRPQSLTGQWGDAAKDRVIERSHTGRPGLFGDKQTVAVATWALALLSLRASY